MSTLNDLFRIEHKDQLKQLETKDIILQQHYVGIDAHWILLDDQEKSLQKREIVLEVKWKEMTNLINDHKKRMTNSKGKVSDNQQIDHTTKIDNQIQQGLDEIKQYIQEFEELHTKCSFSFTAKVDQKQTEITKVVHKQQSNTKTCI